MVVVVAVGVVVVIVVVAATATVTATITTIATTATTTTTTATTGTKILGEGGDHIMGGGLGGLGDRGPGTYVPGRWGIGVVFRSRLWFFR